LGIVGLNASAERVLANDRFLISDQDLKDHEEWQVWIFFGNLAYSGPIFDLLWDGQKNH
jgi:hypothetical protein